MLARRPPTPTTRRTPIGGKERKVKNEKTNLSRRDNAQT